MSSHVYQDFMNCHLPPDLAGSLNTLPVPISRKDCPFKARFVFAYGVDNSDKPSYLLWPIRGGNGQFLLVDPWSGNYFDLEAAKFMEPIGIEHFFDAFSLDRRRPLKVDAAAALRIPLNEVSDSLVVQQDRANRFELTPVWAPVEPPTKLFFYCIAELAIKPCRSSRTNTRGGYEKFHDTCKTRNQHTTKQQNTQNKQTKPTQPTNGKCHWMVRQVVKKSETSEAARSSHVLNSTRKHKVSLVQLH